ncbi:MAG: sodium:proton antiporter [Phycisphaerales bacterium]|nr:sodium:proton antiporter [Phycisphaerales bacterium]
MAAQWGTRLAAASGVVLLGWVVYRFLTTHASGHDIQAPAPSALAVLPFVGMLLSIAVLPLISRTQHWWEHNRNKLIVSAGFAGMALLYYAATRGWHGVEKALIHSMAEEYLPFIILLFCLYVISGGINLKGDLPAHPLTNTAFLGIGAALASLIGTTGASMLLIRPLLQTNSERRHVKHTVIFFIFLVSNVGGCLLPIGDPPLFLGYLQGVPFLWTLNLWKEWLFLSAGLLMVYYFWDRAAYRHETLRDLVLDETQVRRLTLRGGGNLLLLLGVVLCVALIKPGEALPGTALVAPHFLREMAMLGMVAVSLWRTPSSVREANQFNYTAIIEVAVLFIGIFISMQPPLELLRAGGDDIGKVLDAPWKFFWVTGALSSFLDNAPTYLVFFQIANSMTHQAGPGVFQLLDGNFIRQDLLVAISLGAVFMGANTYIGNGPNFMVKSIAEQSGVKMPSFFGYMVYSVGILVPLFVGVTLLFL